MSITNSFCTNCGSSLGSEDRFCPACGHEAAGPPLVASSAPPADPHPPTPAAPPPPTPAGDPQLVGGRFQLVGVLGRGASGTVYLATEEPAGAEVALKSLDPALASTPAFRDRFRAEAATLAGLSHPNLVRVRDYLEDDTGAYLVMDRVEGPSLRQLLSSYGRLAPEQACGVLCGALSGLGSAHDHHLLHGDVKPENVLIDPAGVSKLTDFGQAVPLGSVASGGSAPYLSPEAIEGRPLDQRSDLYAMGVVLYECLAGRPPFVADQVPTVLHQAVHQLPPAIPGLPSPMADLVARALAKEPDPRPASAQQFLDELTEAASRSYGADWATRAGVAALAGAVGVGVAVALGTGGAGAAESGAASGLGSSTAASVGTAPPPLPSTPTGAVPGSGTTAHGGPRWLPKAIAGHKVVATIVAAVVVVAAIAGLALATRHSSTGANVAASATTVPHSSGKPVAGAGTTGPSQAGATRASWSTGQPIGTNGQGLSSVACPTVTHCVAVGDSGDAFTYSGGAWSSGQPIVPNDGLSSISCTTTKFCVAVDDEGHAFTYTGGTWSSGQVVDSGQGTAGGDFLDSVSCPSSTFCAAVGGPSAFMYSNGSWSSGQQIDAVGNLSSISCPSARFCVAADSHGYVFTYSAGAWSAARRIDPDADASALAYYSVSCPSASFCLAAGYGLAYTYSGGVWSKGRSIDADGSLASISCPTRTYCVAADGEGNAFVYSGGEWSSGEPIIADQSGGWGAIHSISCAAVGFCVAGGNADTPFVYSEASSSGGAPSPTPSTAVPATTPPTAPPPTNPLPTVDSSPNGGSAFTPVVRPSTIQLSGDATNIITGITWTRWDSQGATGSGTVDVLTCVPDCASGGGTTTPTTVELSDPVNGVFSQLIETIQGSPPQTFTLPTGP